MPPRPMTILMTADCMGGVWTYALELAESLAPFGVTVELATMGRVPSEQQAAQAAGMPNLHLHASTYRLEWMDDPWRDVAAAGEWLLDLEHRFEPQLIHLNGFAHAGLAWQAPVLVVGHSCVCSWWRGVHGEGPPGAWERYRQEVAAGLHAADVVVAPTRAMLVALEEHYGRVRHAAVIPNGRDAARFRAAEAEPLIFAAGRIWDPAKNLAALEAVAADLPWPVYLAGERAHPRGGSTNALRHVQPLGPLAPGEMAHWLSRAAIYAHPARYEPFGLGPLEAGLAGCALVLGDIPSLREVWADAATFVAPTDATALREALRRLIADPQHRAEMARRAQQRALTYDRFTMAERYMTLYRELAGPPGEPLEGRETTVASAPQRSHP